MTTISEPVLVRPTYKTIRVVDTNHPSYFVSHLCFNDLKGVRIAFVNMPLRETAKPNTPPQGPGLMAARLRQYGAEVSIIDLNAYRLQDEVSRRRNLPLGRHLTQIEARELMSRHFHKHGEPDIIALSGMITTLRWQEFIAMTTRSMCPDSIIISGGGLATEIREGLLGWIPQLDAVAHSEGDDVILLLAHDVKQAKEKGLTLAELDERPYRRLVPGGLLYNGDRPHNLDELPFAAWDLLHEDVDRNPILEWYIKTPVWGGNANNSSATSFTMERSLTTVSSRGCPYACKFCFRGAQGERDYGMRSAENLRKEAQWLKETYNIDFLGMPDDNFAVNPARMKALPDTFRELNLRWGTHTRLDEADMDRLVPMQESGCVYIGFGAESASENVLESMGKGGFILRPRGSSTNQLTEIDGYKFPATMITGIRNCREMGIHGNCTWIMGYPGEGLKDLKTSVAFVQWQLREATQGKAPGTLEYKTAYDSINQKMFVATAYPGTAMCRDQKVQALLKEHFGLSFQDVNGKTEPIVDKHLREYVLELDDATKVMHGTSGSPIYYGDMDMDKFLEARGYVDAGTPEKILNMTE